MTPERETFIINLHSEAKTHDDWLTIVRFGLPTLLENQLLLVELIGREAMRELNLKITSTMNVSEKMSHIFNELNLKITVNDRETPTT